MRGVKESNQRKGDPGIRADRALPARCPAVLGGHRPANNSAIPGLKQFAFPRWSALLLGAPQGAHFKQEQSDAGVGLSAQDAR